MLQFLNVVIIFNQLFIINQLLLFLTIYFLFLHFLLYNSKYYTIKNEVE